MQKAKGERTNTRVHAAAETFADHCLFVVDDEQWGVLQTALDANATAKPQLQALLTKPGLFD